MDREYLVIGYRADQNDVAMLDTKVKASGLTRSEFLRRLVAQAEVTPVQIRVKNNRIDAKVSQGLSVNAVGA